MHKNRILIVEDEGIAAMSLENRLGDLGYESAGVALSAGEAIEKCRTSSPDLVLMDIKLKGEVDGIQAAQEIQRNHQIPIVFVSAYSDDATINRAASQSPFGYLVKPLRDSTVKTTIEMALKKAELERRLKEAEHELRLRAEELARSNQDLERFASIASHDLQSPLRRARLYLQLLLKSQGDLLDKNAQEFVDFIQADLSRMTELTRDILEYSHARKKSAKTETVPLSGVVSEAIALLGEEIDRKRACICVDELPAIQGNRSQLHRLFINLLSNALKYTKREPRIEIRSRTVGEESIVEVRDNGIGIEASELPRLFEMFHRSESETLVQGTGIGLASCERIMHNHGGRIWASSEVGAGSTFYVAFPIGEMGTKSTSDSPEASS